jgi:uncharacterized SAM-binding protein YcdF (DUF218 family)
MFFLVLKNVFGNLILPPSGPLLLSFVGLLLLKRRPAFARACLLLGIASLWLLSTPAVSDVISRWAEAYPPLPLREVKDAQAIVILGGGGQREFAPEYGGPAVDPYSLERVSYGAFVARETNLPILVTGFPVEVAAMRASLERNFNIDARWTDAQARDTFENARNSSRMLQADGVHRIILVTRAVHMRRAAEEFIAAGLEVIPAPVGVLGERDVGFYRLLPNPDALTRSNQAIREFLGMAARRFFTATHLRRQ